jgi:hypothetical protein
MASPVLIYQPGGGTPSGLPGPALRAGNLYYWPDIEHLTGGLLETDLDAQNIYALPADSLIIVTIENRGESQWLRVLETDTPTPVTDLNAGIIVPTNFDSVLRPYVLHRQLGF